MAQKKSKGKNPSNAMYLETKKWIKNKAKKIAKHQKLHPNDKQPVGNKVDYKRSA